MDYRKLSCYSNAPKKQINVIVEIPKGTYNKYEIDEKTGDQVYAVRQLHKGFPHDCKYVFHYGFIPSTLAPDGDQLDAIIITKKSYKPLDVVKCEIFGMIPTIDNGEIDNKVLAIPIEEELDLMHTKWMEKELKKINKFIRIYKWPNHKKTVVNEMVGRKEAIEDIEKYRIKKDITKPTVAKTIHPKSTSKHSDPFGTVIDRVNF